MKVDEDFEVVFATPKSGLFEEIPLVELEERLTRADFESPVTDRDANVVKTSSSDLSDIVLADETVKMLLQDVHRLLTRLQRAESPLVDNLTVARRSVDARRDKVSTTNQPPRLTPRTLVVVLSYGHRSGGSARFKTAEAGEEGSGVDDASYQRGELR